MDKSEVEEKDAGPDTGESSDRQNVVIYGHSLGGAVAVKLLNHLSTATTQSSVELSNRLKPRLKALILENTFTSVPDMVKALYPHRLLPYRYLGPFVLDRYESLKSLKSLKADSRRWEDLMGRLDILFLESEMDEIDPAGDQVGEGVGKGMMRQMFDVIGDGREYTKEVSVDEGERERSFVTIPAALHDTAYLRPQWRNEVLAFVARSVQKKS